jgi:hypothetical protein
MKSRKNSLLNRNKHFMNVIYFRFLFGYSLDQLLTSPFMWSQPFVLNPWPNYSLPQTSQCVDVCICCTIHMSTLGRSHFCWLLPAYLNVKRESSNTGRRIFPHSLHLLDTKERFQTVVCGHCYFTSQCCLQVFRKFSSYYLQNFQRVFA